MNNDRYLKTMQRNMVGAFDSTRETHKAWMITGYDRTTDMNDTLFFNTIDEAKEYVQSNPWFLIGSLYHLNYMDKSILLN